jgi:hypothetical protein
VWLRSLYHLKWKRMKFGWKDFVGKDKGKRSPGRPRRRWTDKIKMNLGDI